MENFDLDFFNEVNEIYPSRDIEYNYFDTFSLVYNLEQKTFPVEILNDELFSKSKIAMYSSLNLDSIDTFMLRLNELESIVTLKEYPIFFLHCAFYFQSIKIIEYLKIKLNFDFSFNNFYFAKLAIKYNLSIVFDYLIIDLKIDTFKELTEDGNSCLCFTVNYSRMAMMYKLLNTLDRKMQTKESLLLVQYSLLVKNVSIINLLYLHDYIDLKLLKNVEFTV
jgi:hypothetical protein